MSNNGNGTKAYSANYTNQYTTTGDRVLTALEPFKVKARGRYNIPWRDGSDSGGLAVKIDPDGEHGAYTDHVSGESGSLYDLAEKLGVELPTGRQEAPYNSKRAYSGLADYAQAHGVTAEYLQSCGWRETTYRKRPALEFQTDGGKRYRMIDGQGNTYEHSKGYKSCLYGLDRAIELGTKAGYVVACNGEISTLAAQNRGLPAICITGGSERAWPAKLIEELNFYWRGPVVVALDCDTKGREATPKQRAAFEQHGNFQSVRAVDLRLGDKGDISDFCLLHGDLSNDKLLACPDFPNDTPQTATEAPKYRLIGLKELLAMPPPEKLKDTMLEKGGLNVLYGLPGCGKTFLALDWSLQVAQDAPVLYIASEGIHGYADRVLGWCNHNHKGEGGFKMLQTDGALNLLDHKQIDGFINQTLLGFRPALIVLDTLAWSLPGGDENSQTVLTAAMDSCRKMARASAPGCTILVIHHTTKDGSRIRGASSLLGAVDVAMLLESQDDRLKLTSTKERNAEPFDDQYMTMIPAPTCEGRKDSRVLVPSDKIAFAEHGKLTGQQKHALEVLSMETFRKVGAKATQVADESNIARGSIYRVLSGLMKRGLVAQSDKGEPFFITDKGKDTLSELSSLSKHYHDNNDNGPSEPSYQLSSLSHSFRSDNSDNLIIGGGSEETTQQKTLPFDRKKYQQPPDYSGDAAR